MNAMSYFVGTWTCQATPVGMSALDVTVEFVRKGDILREWDEVLIPGAATPYTVSKSITWDAKNMRWVQVQGDSDGAWVVSYLKPWTGITEEWLDQASSGGKLGREETIRTASDRFSFKNYAKPADSKPTLVGTCTRKT